jgi:hypothetical protein
MNNVDVEGDGGQHGGVRCRAIAIAALFAAILVPMVWMASDWATRMALLHTMLGENSYSLKNDPATVSRVKAVAPRRLEIHREAVADCGAAKMDDLSRMDAFNRRIKSWRAILMAMDVTADASSIAYVEAFVNSDRTLPEEVTSGKDALQQTWGKKASTDTRPAVPGRHEGIQPP